VRLTGGALTGIGSVDGFTATGGRIAPGDGVGTLTSTASVKLLTAADFEPQVNMASGDPHDVLKVQGKVFYGGATLGVQPTFLNNVSTAPTLIDDSASSFTATGGFSAFGGGGLGLANDNGHFARARTGADPAEQATWTFTNLPPGSYRVSASSGFGLSNQATNSPFTILNGTTPVATVRINQQTPTADFSALNIGWQILGVVQVTGNSLTVSLTNDADGVVIADAILLEPHQVVIIDNDGTDAVQGTFAGLPEGAQVSAIASSVVNGQTVKQTQFYTISYHANDGNDVGLAYVTTATAVANLQVTPTTIHEGQQVRLTGHLTDPDVGDFLTLTIDWGDGRSETHHPGIEDFDFAHRYAGNPPGRPQGTYTVHVTWFDQHGAGNSRDLTVTVTAGGPGSGLRAGGPTSGGKVTPLTGRELEPILLAAIDRWAAAGLDAKRLDLMRNSTVSIENLGGSYLGLADPVTHGIRIDDDAAGHGWFVDSTPFDDSEFSKPNKRVGDRMDLVSVVAHELGHVVGLDHDGDAKDVMGESLTTGTRRVPTATDVKEVVPTITAHHRAELPRCRLRSR
jgi:hypothetical protein